MRAISAKSFHFLSSANSFSACFKYALYSTRARGSTARSSSSSVTIFVQTVSNALSATSALFFNRPMYSNAAKCRFVMHGSLSLSSGQSLQRSAFVCPTYRRSMPFQSVHLSSFFSLLMSAALIQSLKNTAGITVKIVATQQQISKIAIHSGDCPAMICLTEKIISKIKRTIWAISHIIPRTTLFAKFLLSIEITFPHQFAHSVLH